MKLWGYVTAYCTNGRTIRLPVGLSRYFRVRRAYGALEIGFGRCIYGMGRRTLTFVFWPGRRAVVWKGEFL